LFAAGYELKAATLGARPAAGAERYPDRIDHRHRPESVPSSRGYLHQTVTRFGCAARDRLYALRDELASTGATITVIAKNLALRTAASRCTRSERPRRPRRHTRQQRGVAYGGPFTMDPEAVTHGRTQRSDVGKPQTTVADMVTRGAGTI
jgi:hypothetical protein